jgi:hypothetical protein
MRYRLRTLLIAMVFVGVLSLALRTPNEIWAWAGCLAAVLSLLTSVLVTIYRNGSVRAFAVGYLVFGGGFLALLLLLNSGRLAGDNQWNPLGRTAVILYEYIYGSWVTPGHFTSFLEIANAALVIVLGVVGGVVAQLLYVGRPRHSQ